MITERIQLEQDVSGPAGKAAAGVRLLAESLKEIGPEGIKAANALAALTRAQTAAAGGSAGIAAKIKADAAASAAASKAAAVAAKAAAQETTAATKAKGAAEKAASAAAKAAARDEAASERAAAKAASAAAREVEKAERDKAKAANAAAKEIVKAEREQEKARKANAGGKRGLGPALPRTLESGFGSSVATIVGGIAVAKAGELAAQAVAAAGQLALASGKAALDAAAFKQDTLRSFALLTGSAAAAQTAFDAGIALSKQIGGGPTENIAALQALMSRGFKLDGTGQALDVLRAMADLKVISPSANTDAMVNAMAQIRSKGKLQMEELQGQLGESFDVGAVLDAIGKKLGKTQDQVRALISAGKIDADTGILGILDAIEKKTGKKLGQAAAQAQNGLSGLRKQLENWPDSFLMSLDLDGSRVESFMRSVVAAVDPTSRSGKKLVQSTNELADAITGLFEAGTKGDGKAVEGLVKALAGLEGGFAKGIKEATPALTTLITVVGQLTGMKDSESAAYAIGTALGYLTVAILGLGAALIGPFLYVGKVIGDVIEGLRALAAPATSAGQSIGQGIVRGLLSALTFGLSEVFYAGSKLGAAGTAGVAAGAQTHSPSVATTKVGQGMVAGLVNATYAGVPQVARAGVVLGMAAVGGVAANDGGGARPAAPVQAVGGGAGGGGAPVVVHVHLDAGAVAAAAPAGGAEAIGQRVGDAAGRAIFRRIREAA